MGWGEGFIFSPIPLIYYYVSYKYGILTLFYIVNVRGKSYMHLTIIQYLNYSLTISQYLNL